MVVWDLNPVLLALGPLEIRWYGLVYALGFLLGWLILRKAAKEKTLKNLSVKDAEDYIFLLIVGSLVVSRLFHVFVFTPGYYFANPLEIPAIWRGGLSIHGGLLGAFAVTYWFCKKRKINFWQMADLLILPLALVYAFGRVVNYVNGELWGNITNISWCVEFPNADGCRHPSQLYQALAAFTNFTILTILYQTQKLRDGMIFWIFILLYGLFRFVVTPFRAPEPGEIVILGITIGRWISLAMVFLALWWFGKQKWRLTK